MAGVDIALAIPGLVDVILRGAKFVYDRIRRITENG